MFPLAILPAGVVSLLALVAILALLWYALRFLPEPVAQLRWLGYVVILLVICWWLWTHYVR
jgi:hypothetical protein